MFAKYIAFLVAFKVASAIYPYFDTQDFIYNVPKVYRISITLDKMLEYYEKKPSKDPEWHISLGMARGQLEYTINELDKSVPAKLKENLQNLTRRMDRIRNNTDITKLVYRSKDYEYGPTNLDIFPKKQGVIRVIFAGESFKDLGKDLLWDLGRTKNTFYPGKAHTNEFYAVQVTGKCWLYIVFGGKLAKAMFENMEVLASVMEPLTIGTMGTQKPYRFNFEQYVQEARTKMPGRKAADACTMQLLISAMETQTTQAEGSCELTPECSQQLMQGSGLAFQQTSRLRAATLARLFDCMEGVDLTAYIYKLCIQIYKETKSLEAWDHPAGTKTIFMQQIAYCASQGYGEFIKPRWMNKIVSWQEPKGCYSDDRQPFLRLTGFVGPASAPPPTERAEEYRVKKAAESEGGACNSLTSAMALSALVVYVRALLETDQAFQYDVLL